MKLYKGISVTHIANMHFGDVIGRIRPSLSTANKVRWFIGLLLLVFGIGKGGGLFMSDINWKMGDPVLIWVPHSMVFVTAAVVEIAVGLLLMVRRTEVRSLDYTLFAWVGSLVGYQIIRSFYKIVLPCRCLGLWQQWLGLSDTAANIASLVSLGLLGLGCLMIGLENTESHDSHSSQLPSSLS
jgi:hypothetical protein